MQQPMRIKSKNSCGFTLLELLLVAIVAGIAAALAIPALVEWVPEYRLRSAASELYSNLQWVKMEAVRRNTQCGIVFDTGSGRYFLCLDSGADGLWTTVGDNSVTMTVDLSDFGSGVTFGHGNATGEVLTGDDFEAGHVTYDQAVVLFSPIGISDAGFTYLENGRATTAFAVGTLPSGVILIRKWAGGGWR